MAWFTRQIFPTVQPSKDQASRVQLQRNYLQPISAANFNAASSVIEIESMCRSTQTNHTRLWTRPLRRRYSDTSKEPWVFNTIILALLRDWQMYSISTGCPGVFPCLVMSRSDGEVEERFGWLEATHNLLITPRNNVSCFLIKMISIDLRTGQNTRSSVTST